MISQVLRLHGIGYQTIDNRILADEVLTTADGRTEVLSVDVTDYDAKTLKIWLGY